MAAAPLQADIAPIFTGPVLVGEGVAVGAPVIVVIGVAVGDSVIDSSSPLPPQAVSRTGSTKLKTVNITKNRFI